MNIVWTPAEHALIKKLAPTMKDEELCRKLENLSGRKISLQALRKQRRKLGIIKHGHRGIFWCIEKQEDNIHVHVEKKESR